MLEHLGGRERHNIRPIVLGVCFACGLIFGFVFYLVRPSFAEQDKQEEQKLADQKPKKPVEKPKPTVAAPGFTSINKANDAPLPKLAVEKVDPDELTTERDRASEGMRAIPEPQTLPINFDTGLSGKTTYRPLPPVKREKPVPVVNPAAKPVPAAGRKPVNINEIAPPELEEY